jgi:Zn-dependent peptidase ImmA (M78 family)
MGKKMSDVAQARPDYRLCSQKAEMLLKKYGFFCPPIDPELIAEEEGLRVVYAQFEPPYDEKTSGFFRLEDKTIVVNGNIPDKRITFTVAHELGHFILHENYISSNSYIPMPRNNTYDGEKPRQEKEADMFAADLLVPLRMLKKYAPVAGVDELSRLFFVSREVIVNRLDLLSRHPGLAR